MDFVKEAEQLLGFIQGPRRPEDARAVRALHLALAYHERSDLSWQIAKKLKAFCPSLPGERAKQRIAATVLADYSQYYRKELKELL